jgi:hypothetical protein
MAIALFRKSSPYAIAFSSFCGGLDGNLAKLKIYSTQIQRRYTCGRLHDPMGGIGADPSVAVLYGD